MTNFYQRLRTATIKADALREAQIAMLQGQVRFQDGKLQIPGLAEQVSLPAELANVRNKMLQHPFY